MSRLNRVTRLVLTCCLLAQGSAGLRAQVQPAEQTLSSDPDTAVASLIDRILTRGETVQGTIRMSTYVPPTAEDIAAIKHLGSSAIPPLDKAFTAKRSFQRLLVTRLLGEIGGPEIVPTLRRALDPALPNSVRASALDALTTAPDDLALPLIRTSVKDPDTLVASKAKSLLADRYRVAVDQ